MMFFLARSAFCIGLVAVAASGVETGRLTSAVDRGARDTLAGAGRACLASRDCLQIGTAALSAATGVMRDGGAEASNVPPIPPPPRMTAPHRSEARPLRRSPDGGG